MSSSFEQGDPRPSNEESLGAGRGAVRRSCGGRNELDSHTESDGESSSSASEKRGEDILEDIFWEFNLQRNGNDEAVLDTIVKVLRESPHLASKRFEHRPYSSMASVPVNPRTTSHTGFKLLPFTNLLIGGASLDVIKELLDMAPPCLDYREEMPDHQIYPLIHTACLHRSHDTDLIRYLARRNPISLDYATDTVSLPIHIALDKYAPLETIEALLDLAPSTLNKEDPHSNMDCLQRALLHSSPVDQSITDLFVDRLIEPETQKYFRFENSQLVMTRESSEALLKLLPHFHTFACIPGSWQADAWIHLLTNMTIETTLLPKVLHLELPWEVATEVDECCRALSQFLGASSGLRSLRLKNQFSKEVSSNTTQIVRAIADGLARKGSVQRLVLSQFPMSEDTPIADLLMVPGNLKMLQLENVDLSGTLWQPSTINVCHSSIEELSFIGCKVRSDYHYSSELLRVLAEMPRLKELKLSQVSWNLRLIQHLAHLIGKNRLESLTLLDDATLDMSLISLALQENTSLHTLGFLASFSGQPTNMHTLRDVLHLHNTTLKKFFMRPGATCINEAVQVGYWVLLNQCGRGQVRSSNVTVSDFVDLIINAKHAQTTHHQSLLYGLLRECPGIWCNVPVSERREDRKRKRTI